jgi:hypothetical protein
LKCTVQPGVATAPALLVDDLGQEAQRPVDVAGRQVGLEVVHEARLVVADVVLCPQGRV